jgi:peptide/nickel transport system substrate-binding protein
MRFGLSAESGVRRRDVLRLIPSVGLHLGLATTFFEISARARARTPLQGSVSLRIPWPLGSIDPHQLDDGTAAILGDALFDSLYTEIPGGFYACIAEGAPVFENGMIRVPIREGLRSAAGASLDARDVVFSLERARKRGVRGLFGDLPVAKTGSFAVTFAAKDASIIPKLQRALSSPLAAIVPRGFDPENPDGTGPFRIRRRGDGWALTRNPFAVRSPSYLDTVLLAEAPDLSASLRSFESGKDDIGWLGLGLHEPRPSAVAFDHGAVGVAILRLGREAGTWNTPGTAQRLCDGLPHGRLSYLGIGAPWPKTSEEGWGGASATLLVREDAPWLVELARAVAATLARPGHDLTVKPVSEAERTRALSVGAFAMMVDIARPLFGMNQANAQSALGAFGMLAALVTANDPGLSSAVLQRPPRLTAEASARTMTRTMHIGVLGELRVQGGRAADLSLPGLPHGGIDFSSATRGKR